MITLIEFHRKAKPIYSTIRKMKGFGINLSLDGFWNLDYQVRAHAYKKLPEFISSDQCLALQLRITEENLNNEIPQDDIDYLNNFFGTTVDRALINSMTKYI